MSYGKITVVSGPMCSGKSLYLSMLIEREYLRSRGEVLITKPFTDTREGGIFTRGRSKGMPLTGWLEDYITLFQTDVQAVSDFFTDAKLLVVDEIQLYQEFKELREFVDYMSMLKTEVVLAGLDTSFRGEPFETTALMSAVADEVIKLSAVCKICGEDATRTQRLVDGIPAKYSDPLIVIDDGNCYDGHEIGYEARCRKCHEVLR